ncbi:MAG: nucleotidyltransferase family protein [Planctomycetes bacterium]|nr:nucleotidyltransferase family protein [Planctomycetota bacterium]
MITKSGENIVDAILLAGGYATRLYPLTKDRPKALLPVGGKPILDYVVEELETSDKIDKLFLVTNAKFAPHFQEWADRYVEGENIQILDDGTDSNADRLGALGDVRFVLNHADVDTDSGVYVLGTDNLADFNITDIVDLALEKKGSAVFASRIDSEGKLTRMGVATVNDEGRVVDFIEKPDDPPSNLAVPPFYVYSPNAVQLLRDYLNDESNNPDAPGHYISWLVHQDDVYALITDQTVLDIGTPESYQEVQEKWSGGEEMFTGKS